MKAEATCDRIRSGLSARLDNELDAESLSALEAHLAGCAACRRYEESLRAVKRAVALQPAPATRDLTPGVIARIQRSRLERRAERRGLARTAIAAAAATALILSSAIVPWRQTEDVARASEITQAVQSAAVDITSYHAVFNVIERGWHADVPERRFTAEMWFDAPERLRMEVTDETSYPGTGWPTNDATLIANADRWWLKETASCPAAALPGCEVAPEPEIRTLARRQPFDGNTALPTDLILPLETLASEAGLTVLGLSQVDGRDAQHVVLEYWQAAPLVDSLQVAGTWRPWPARARVDLWLDASTWFPLRFTVRSGGDALIVETTTLERPSQIAPATFVPPERPRAADGGFRNDGDGGVVPSYVAGLDVYRSGITREKQNVVAFANGMTWLKVLTDEDADATISTFTSEVVPLGNRGVGYIEPSGDPLRRTLEIFGPTRRIRIESNLPRHELLKVAASVPVTGRSIDHLESPNGTTLERMNADAVAGTPYVMEPAYLPDGFAFSSAFLSRSRAGTEQLTVYYRRRESSSLTNEIRVIHIPGVEVLPPSSENLVAIDADGLSARWSPLRSELEWLDGTTYRAVAVPAFDLTTAIRIARDLES